MNMPPRDDPETLRLARVLNTAKSYIDALPTHERRIALLAADGAPVWEIAAGVGESDEAVSRLLGSIEAAVSGRPVQSVESGGLGADTDPGIGGGFDDSPGGIEPDSTGRDD